MATSLIALWLLTALRTPVQHSLEPEAPQSFTVYSDPVELRYGQVYMTSEADDVDEKNLPLPAKVAQQYADGKRNMTASRFLFDIVRIDPKTGEEFSVPLNEVYNHHAKFTLGEGESQITIGVGADFRGSQHVFPAPYRQVAVRPRGYRFFIHFIDVSKPGRNEPGGFSRLSQCPCTPQRHINATNGTIEGTAPDPPIDCSTNAERLVDSQFDPSCSLSTYAGGVRCCHHGVFLVDTSTACTQPECTEHPLDRVYFKATTFYENETPSTVSLHMSFLDGIGSNSEYTVPACTAGTPPAECVHTLRCEQRFGRSCVSTGTAEYCSGEDADADLIIALPHMHSTALAIELQDAETNRTLCSKSVANGGLTYGTGVKARNETGFLTGLGRCDWGIDAAPLLRNGQMLRGIATYNASMSQFGVMAQWMLYSVVRSEAAVL
jgi:hypothetical protein